MARPVFILSSGRSGTYQITHLLGINPDLEVHHEYEFGQTLMHGVKSYMFEKFREDLATSLVKTHRNAVDACTKDCWIDVSNALPWTLPTLLELFPDGRFILLVRNGRRVVSSFFHKFENELYHPEVLDSILQWRDSGGVRGGPSKPELWRPLPPDWQPSNLDAPDRFDLLCWYWSQLNEHVRKEVEKCAADFYVFRFEDIISRRDTLRDFLALMETELSQRHIDELRRPVNVAVPKTFPLSQDQEISFWNICGPTMESFGYSEKDDYVVEY